MKTVNTQIATSMTADFDESTWTFLMSKGFQVWAGKFAIVDKQIYDELIKRLKDAKEWVHEENEIRNGTYVRLIKSVLEKCDVSENYR